MGCNCNKQHEENSDIIVEKDIKLNKNDNNIDYNSVGNYL